MKGHGANQLDAVLDNPDGPRVLCVARLAEPGDRAENNCRPHALVGAQSLLDEPALYGDSSHDLCDRQCLSCRRWSRMRSSCRDTFCPRWRRLRPPQRCRPRLPSATRRDDGCHAYSGRSRWVPRRRDGVRGCDRPHRRRPSRPIGHSRLGVGIDVASGLHARHVPGAWS